MQKIILSNKLLKFVTFTRCHLHYVQGQKISSNIREYFYYIDHRGQLFLDDSRVKNFVSCFKDKQFLRFFFSRLKTNNSEKYENEFPFISPCGPELNFVRCDDLPVVFEKILTSEEWTAGDKDKMPNPESASAHLLVYAGGQLSMPFSPSEILVDPSSGRLYHPAPPKTSGVGLVGSNLAQQLSENFVFDKRLVEGGVESEASHQKPTHIHWNGVKVLFTNNYSALDGVAKLQGPKYS